MIQYLNNGFPISLDRSSGNILFTNLLIITWAVFYMLGYYIRNRICGFKCPAVDFSITGKKGIYLSIYLSLVIFIVFLLLFGLENLMVRGAYREVLYSIKPQALMIILDKFLRVIPIISLMALIVTRKQWKNRRRFRLLLYALIIINLVVNNPLASARYWAGIITLALLAVLFRAKRMRKFSFVVLILIGILFLLPVSNSLRDKTEIDFTEDIIDFAPEENIYCTPNYDAYEMFVHTVEYTQKKGYTFGRQLLGGLLFWIPRSLWENKPIGSGWFISKELYGKGRNLSCPLPAEGWINGGIIGLILFAFILGWIVSEIDYRYWNYKQTGMPIILMIYYPFLLGFTFFLMRGDFMSGFSYTVMFIIAGLPLLLK